MTPHFFAKQIEFRKWLVKNHATAKELLVGFYKVDSNKPSMTWSQSVDEALCFGWIDGVRSSIDKDSYSIRFTPRKPTSIWSTVNIKKMEELKRFGLMQPAGLIAFEKREEKKSGIYAYENEPVKLSTGYKKTFMANKKAWAFFTSQATSYQKVAINWVMSAKQDATQLTRLDKLIKGSEAGKKI